MTVPKMPPATRTATAVLMLAVAALPQRARAQETDGRWLLAIGIAPLGFRHAATTFDGGSEQTSSAWEAGLGAATLMAGSGMGRWVFAIELSVTHEEQESEQVVDIISSATIVDAKATETRFSVGPSVRYLFTEGGIRPFVEFGVGAGMAHSDLPQDETKLTVLSAHTGPGLQLELAEAASLDLHVRAAYRSSSGKLTTQTQPFADPAFFDGEFDVDVDTLEVALHARLSIWL